MYEIISRKRDGGIISREEIEFFINGYVNGIIPDYQASALLMAVFFKGLNPGELTALTEVMLQSGDRISLDGVSGKKIDKHSTGGVGDKVSFVVSPLVAACGVKVPMLSGRGLGHTGGTLDKLESIPGFQVFLQSDKFKQVLEDVGMVICGQTDNLVPADKKLYALRDATATVNSIPLITSSIMSKKLALGTQGIVLDVKTGKGAFMKNLDDSIKLCETLVLTGESSGRRTVGLITNMDQPLGQAVGNSLEIIESIEALKGNGPADLMEVTFAIGAYMLIAAGVASKYRDARVMLENALESGAALEVFKKFIKAQGGDPEVCSNYQNFPGAGHRIPFLAKSGGYIHEIDALEVGLAAIDLGAGRRKKEDPINYGTGFGFQKKIGDPVEVGETIAIIHTDNREVADRVSVKLEKAVKISREKIEAPELILYIVDKDGVKDWSGSDLNPR